MSARLRWEGDPWKQKCSVTERGLGRVGVRERVYTMRTAAESRRATVRISSAQAMGIHLLSESI